MKMIIAKNVIVIKLSDYKNQIQTLKGLVKNTVSKSTRSMREFKFPKKMDNNTVPYVDGTN